MKKSITKRMQSLLLCLVLVLPYVPVCVSAASTNVAGGLEGQKADIFSALGFDTSVEPFNLSTVRSSSLPVKMATYDGKTNSFGSEKTIADTDMLEYR